MSNKNNLQTNTSSALHNVIMEAGGKDLPPMLAPGNYVQWKSQIKRYIDTKPNHELIHYCIENLPCKYQWIPNPNPDTPATPGIDDVTPIHPTRVMETYATISEDIKKKMDVEAEAVQIILTGIDNDIYSTVDACPNAMEMKFTSRNGETLDSYYSSSYFSLNQNGKGKEIANIPSSKYDSEPEVVSDEEVTRMDKEIEKLMALISISFKKIYKPTNNNLRTSSNTRNKNIDNTPRSNKRTGYDRQTGQYENQRAINVAEARDNVRTQVVQQTGHVARECKKEKWVRDLTYQKEKMMLCKQEEAGIELSVEQVDWRDDTDDEHPLAKVQNNDDNYNVFANERQHPQKPESINDTYVMEKDDKIITPDSSDMSDNGREVNQDDDLAKERDLLVSLIETLKCEMDESKK
ncbi:hypothetical protein Tco_1318213 [Tanacetum coccineum]